MGQSKQNGNVHVKRPRTVFGFNRSAIVAARSVFAAFGGYGTVGAGGRCVKDVRSFAPFKVGQSSRGQW